MIPTLFDKMRANRKREIVVQPKTIKRREWAPGDMALHIQDRDKDSKRVQVVQMVYGNRLFFYGGKNGERTDYTHCNEFGERIYMEESE